MTDCDIVLNVLRPSKGEFVANLYGKTGVMVHSRVSELRKRGYVIQMQRFGRGDYRYKLVAEPSTEEVLR